MSCIDTTKESARDVNVVDTLGISSSRRRTLPSSFLEVSATSKRSLLTPSLHDQPAKIILDTPPSWQVDLLSFGEDALKPTSNLAQAPTSTTDIKTYPIRGVPVKFPFKPYSSQVVMMSKIIEALQKGHHAVLESPTGSGKSLALLCGALAWREKEIEKRNNQHQDKAIKVEQATVNVTPKDTDQIVETNFLSQSSTSEISTQPISQPMSESPSQATTQPSTSYQKALPRIYVASRTHKQVAQLVNELKSHTPYRPKMTVLGSRDQYCIHEKVSKSREKNEECNALIVNAECGHHNRTDALLEGINSYPNSILDIEDLKQLAHTNGGCPYFGSRSLGERAELVICPYNYLVDPIIRKVMKINTQGNIIILDEAHNIEGICRDAGTFEVHLGFLQSILSELLDVIHCGQLVAIHQTLADLVTYMISWLQDQSHELDVKGDNQLLHVWSTGDDIKEILQNCFSINSQTLTETLYPAFELACCHADNKRSRKKEVDDADDDLDYDSAPSTHMHSLDDDEEEDVIDLTLINKDTEEKKYRTYLSVAALNMFEKLLLVLTYVLDDERNKAEDFRLILAENTGIYDNSAGATWNRKIAIWCMNPGVIFQDMAKEAHSIILTSGTLTPVTTFEAELETKFPIRFEANHIIQPSQTFVHTIPRGPLRTTLRGVYSTVNSKEYQDDLGQAVAGVCESVPFGILLFVSSYSMLDKLHKRWKETGIIARIRNKKHVMLEPNAKSSDDFNRVLKRFYSHIKKAENGYGSQNGALLLAVHRGKVSEGIDFADNNCRAVIATGIPFPMFLDTKIALKRQFNDKNQRSNGHLLSGDEWYNVQAYRAINQALGRCIRHRNDWGAILIFEERFMEQRHIQYLPKWIRERCTPRNDSFDSIMADLRLFVEQRQTADLNKFKQ